MSHSTTLDDMGFANSSAEPSLESRSKQDNLATCGNQRLECDTPAADKGGVVQSASSGKAEAGDEASRTGWRVAGVLHVSAVSKTLKPPRNLEDPNP